jgi:SAM-dependent methyltransferase
MPTLPDGVTYARLRAVACGRVLDVGCGDAPLGLGLDVRGGHVRGDARAMPFADGVFDTVVSHLGLDVMADLDRVIAEIHRVLEPDGTVAAIVGGGPVADGDDAYHALARMVPPKRVGDRRVRDERAWRGWFREVSFERIELAFEGSFEEMWPVLAGLAGDDSCRMKMRMARLSFRVVCWLVTGQGQVIRSAGSA